MASCLCRQNLEKIVEGNFLLRLESINQSPQDSALPRSRALRFNVDMSRYPTVLSVHNNCLGTKECEAAAPGNQVGAMP